MGQSWDINISESYYVLITHEYDMGRWKNYFTFELKLNKNHSTIFSMKINSKKQGEDIVNLIKAILNKEGSIE